MHYILEVTCPTLGMYVCLWALAMLCQTVLSVSFHAAFWLVNMSKQSDFGPHFICLVHTHKDTCKRMPSMLQVFVILHCAPHFCFWGPHLHSQCWRRWNIVWQHSATLLESQVAMNWRTKAMTSLSSLLARCGDFCWIVWRVAAFKPGNKTNTA